MESVSDLAHFAAFNVIPSVCKNNNIFKTVGVSYFHDFYFNVIYIGTVSFILVDGFFIIMKLYVTIITLFGDRYNCYSISFLKQSFKPVIIAWD